MFLSFQLFYEMTAAFSQSETSYLGNYAYFLSCSKSDLESEEYSAPASNLKINIT